MRMPTPVYTPCAASLRFSIDCGHAADGRSSVVGTVRDCRVYVRRVHFAVGYNIVGVGRL